MPPSAAPSPPQSEDVGIRKGRSGRYSNMSTGSSVEYGVPARPWAVGAGSRRAVYSVLVRLLAV